MEWPSLQDAAQHQHSHKQKFAAGDWQKLPLDIKVRKNRRKRRKSKFIADLQAQVLYQLEYYFSLENLCKDLFFRSKWQSDGFVQVDLLVEFNRLKSLLLYAYRALEKACTFKDFAVDFVMGCVGDSLVLEHKYHAGKAFVRLREGWQQWLVPTALLPQIYSLQKKIASPKQSSEASSEVTLTMNDDDLFQFDEGMDGYRPKVKGSDYVPELVSDIDDEDLDSLVLVTQRGKVGIRSKSDVDIAEMISEGLYLYEKEAKEKEPAAARITGPKATSNLNHTTARADADANANAKLAAAADNSRKTVTQPDVSTNADKVPPKTGNETTKQQNLAETKPPKLTYAQLLQASIAKSSPSSSQMRPQKSLLSESLPKNGGSDIQKQPDSQNKDVKDTKVPGAPRRFFEGLSAASPPVGWFMDTHIGKTVSVSGDVDTSTDAPAAVSVKEIGSFQHPSCELLKENGFIQQNYIKFKSKALEGIILNKNAGQTAQESLRQ